jgi:hypothetical protein
MEKAEETWPEKIELCMGCLYLHNDNINCKIEHRLIRFWHNDMGFTTCRADYGSCPDFDRLCNIDGFFRGPLTWVKDEENTDATTKTTGF